MPVRRLVLDGDDPANAVPNERDVRIVADRIRAGALVVLPTETVYGFAALPERERDLLEVKGRAETQVFTRHLAAARDAGALPDRARALASAFWPGPLTLIVPRDGGTVGLRVPAHAFTRAVIATASSEGLSMTSVNRSGEQPLATAEEIAAAFGDAIDLIVVDDPPQPPLASTIAALVGPELEIVRRGAISEDELLERAAVISVVFVCTGNTCRSPLAEALAKRAFADALGVPIDRLPARGFIVRSAGVAAGFGGPASAGSVEAAREVGLDLSAHRSRPLTPTLLESATHVFCLSPSHAEAILGFMPELTDRVALLDPDGCPVPDPIGGSIELYRETRIAIERAVAARVAQLTS